MSDIFSLRVEIVKLWIQLEWQGVACGELSVRLRDQTFLMEYERTGVILSTVFCNGIQRVISDGIHTLRQICSNNSSQVRAATPAKQNTNAPGLGFSLPVA